MTIVKDFKSLNKIAKSRINDTTFDEYKKLSYQEKAAFLRRKGVSLKPIRFMYKGEREKYYMRSHNPFTKTPMSLVLSEALIDRYNLSKIGLSDVYIECTLKIIKNPINADRLIVALPKSNYRFKQAHTDSVVDHIRNSSDHVLKSTFDVKDFLIRTYTKRCLKNRNHELQDVIGIAKCISNKDPNQIIELSFVGAFCPKCRRYYILKSEYIRMLQIGTPLCTTINEQEWRIANNIRTSSFDLNEESKLHALGYNINRPKEIRRKILMAAVSTELLSAYEICSFLDWLIMRHTYDINKFWYAISVWEGDRDFMSYYRRNISAPPRTVEVDKFIRTISIKL